jgi:hypothetical protein
MITEGSESDKFSEMLTARHARTWHQTREERELAYVVWCHQGPKPNDTWGERL